jgi:hypothetical protein
MAPAGLYHGPLSLTAGRYRGGPHPPAGRPGHRSRKPEGLSIDTTVSNFSRVNPRHSIRGSVVEWQSPLLRRNVGAGSMSTGAIGEMGEIGSGAMHR